MSAAMLLQEFRHALRALIRIPSLTAISVLSVALGVGAGTSLFSVVNAVLLNPLPYPDPDRLTWIAEVSDPGTPTPVAYRNFLDWRDGSSSFSGLAAFGHGPAIVSGGEVPLSTNVAVVSQDFFSVMGVHTRIGRTFSAADEVQGAAPVAVIGYGLWQRAFGASSDLIGRTVRIFGIAPTIIGIMPPGFGYPERVELWLPIATFGDPGTNARRTHNWLAVGRLKPGVSLDRAQAEISAIERRIKKDYPSPFQSKDAAVISLQSHIVGEVRTPLLMLFSAVGFLLLIVCVNVANLLLVRVTARSRELAVRIALGAGQRHLFGKMLTESLLLAVAGGAAGLLLAFWSMDLLLVLLPAEVPRLNEIQMDGRVVGFALAVSTAAGLLFGFLPAWRACRMNVNDALKSGSRSATASRQSHGTQAALVVSEVCLSLVLVAGAGLLTRSFWHLQSIDPGFRSGHVLVADASFPNEPDKAKLLPKYGDLLSRVRAIPGVAAAGTVRSLPIVGVQNDSHFFIEGKREETRSADAGWVMVSPGYLSAMRIPLVRGRDFMDSDSENSDPATIISQQMARVYFQGTDPIGQRIWFDSFGAKELWLRIIGVAGDVRQSSLTQKSVYPQAYVCYTQQENPALLAGGTLVVRTRDDPASVAGSVRNAIRAVNPESAPNARTLDSELQSSLARQRFQMEILGSLAVLALLLAAMGLYGVMSYVVTANSVQIGIRLALGAQPSAVFRMITRRALAMAAAGAILGLLGCLAVRRVLAALLFGIGPSDPSTIGAAVAVLLAVSLAAAIFPARRAMRTDPMVALREE